ncbi:MAG: ABC transporter ATP-binding protein [Clostridiaceae bacterium]|jgi:putative ABC transport system ATP-binding protein|nr:ABC transporter ATP-binding protein [Clostridiaceae bacterium]
MIRIENVTKVYKTGAITLTALNGISLHIRPGEFVAVMGPSGCGKSTLLNILGCLDRVTSGRYILNSKDVSTLGGNELASIRNREIGFIFQSFNLLPRMTVLENVELPMIYAGVPARERREKAIEALSRVDLAERIRHRPTEISGGQMQRVAIARAIVNSPSIILADEPTGNLDSRVTEEIMKIIQKLNDEGTTILMVTHEPDVANYSERIVRMRDGRIIDDSPVQNRIIL